MFKDLKTKVGMMSKHKEILNREILEKNQRKVQQWKTQIKYSLDGLNSKLDIAEELTSELKDRYEELSKLKHRNKRSEPQ